MIVYKFGGASVKDANGVKNLAEIVKKSDKNLVIVVSAMGKTTNALEEIVKLSFNDLNECKNKIDLLYTYHFEICKSLFPDNSAEIYKILENNFSLVYSLASDKTLNQFDLKYDQIVSYGEIVSTQIVSNYLNFIGLTNKFIDIREVFITDSTFREAKVNLELSSLNAVSVFDSEKNRIYLTQGFIGRSNNGYSTTLGREGSDYTAAILANFLDAEKMVVWKDVEGVLSADPQYFKDPQRLNKISYQEAVELAYFGAKVIHPKTLKPLHNKNIPLHVKSFINPTGPGTTVEDYKEYDQDLPIYILKKDQMLISLFPKDLSFVIEDGLSEIFQYLSQHRVKVNLIQNSAISISFCIDNSYVEINELLEHLQKEYKVLYNQNLELLTIRHYTEKDVEKLTAGRKIFIEQRSRHTAHFVIK
ncbi:MAG: aspartate kinase [Bacteroidales bacterium]|jgi:aspartate kinase|nr:aspartate kinase [Bacteroidales bacterium]